MFGKSGHDELIDFISRQRRIPLALADEMVNEPQRARKLLFRRVAGPIRLSIFDGGHEGDMPTAVRWLAAQRRN